MEFRTATSAGHDLDEIESGGLRVRISRLGAEMVSLCRFGAGGWQGFLYRDGETGAPASGWGNHATVMGYFIHRLWKEQSVYRGHVIRGGNHGFLRHFAFGEPERLEDGIVYHVPAEAVPPEAYPLRVSLALSYRIIGGSLRIGFDFTNHEPDLDAHLSFGLHPGFAVGSVSSARLLLPAGTYERHLAPGNFLDGRVETIPFPGGEMPFDKAALPGSFLLGIDAVPDKTFVLEDGGRRITLDFSEAPFVTLWSESDHFLCIEPCWGLPDSNPPVPFERKAGIQVVPRAGRLQRSFSITPECLT